MKNGTMPLVLGSLLLLASCAGEPRKIIFDPVSSVDPLTAYPPDVQAAPDSSLITESQSGTAGAFIPGWVERFMKGGTESVEALEGYSGKYIFIAKNTGKNFAALSQWAAGFSAEQDFPRLAAERIAKRLIGAASLYPDDEYGDFFEALVKSASDAFYPDAVKEETFWIKRRSPSTEQESGSVETAAAESYDFFVLISIDKVSLQNRIRELMENIKTAPTRNQAAAIENIRQSFSEGF
ncbi:MAG: hypothetical protein LBP27_07205 [Treponema sp.]|jgi:hypothetical protein|nr:hypothetical protein [Treponema sp.]